MKQEKTPEQLYRIATRRNLQIVTVHNDGIFKWYDPRHIYPKSHATVTGKTPKSRPKPVCPRCRMVLSKGSTMIPIGYTKSVKFTGRRCLNCDRIYIANTDDILAILQNNPFAKDFTFNGNRYETNFIKIWPENRQPSAAHPDNKPLSALRKVPDAVMMICVEWEEGEGEPEKRENQYFIVAREHPDHSAANILLYSNVLARELLTAATYQQRQKRGEFNGRAYSVKDVIFAPVNSRTVGIGKLETIMPTTLYIKEDGGYASSIKNRNYEIVDLLLYAPKTQRYEIIRATYNRLEDICYTDIWLYRVFAREFGRPDSSLEYIKTNGGFIDGMWDELSQESVLRIWGYNVAENNGLSTSQRRELLMDVVDLGEMSIPRIIHLLLFLIDTHSSDKYINARYKWQDDMNFCLCVIKKQ